MSTFSKIAQKYADSICDIIQTNCDYIQPNAMITDGKVVVAAAGTPDIKDLVGLRLGIIATSQELQHLARYAGTAIPEIGQIGFKKFLMAPVSIDGKRIGSIILPTFNPCADFKHVENVIRLAAVLLAKEYHETTAKEGI